MTTPTTTPMITPTTTSTINRIPLEDRVDLAVDDKHNVHNKTLQRNAFHVIQQLKECDQHHYTQESAIDEINSMITKTNKEDTQRILKQILLIDAYYSVGHLKEKELIRLVWERIHHPINHTSVVDLEETFLAQLSDCRNIDDQCDDRDHLSLHCCEGRVMRLLQTLEIHDMEHIVQLRPMWAYRDEIANTIIRYRAKLFEKAPKVYRNLETKSKLSSYDRHLLDQFNQCLIDNLNKRFEIDYIKPGLLTQDEVNDMVRPYYDSLNDF